MTKWCYEMHFDELEYIISIFESNLDTIKYEIEHCQNMRYLNYLKNKFKQLSAFTSKLRKITENYEADYDT